MERFFDFRWVQLKADLDFYKKVGLSLDGDGFTERANEVESQASEVIAKYANTKRPFRDGKGLAHSWLRKGVEDLLKELKELQGEDGGRIELLSRVYVQANRHTHFNPQAVMKLLDIDDDIYYQETDWRVSAYAAFVIGGLCMCWLMRAYLENTPPSPVWSEIPELEKKLDDVEDSLVFFISHIAEFHAR